MNKQQYLAYIATMVSSGAIIISLQRNNEYISFNSFSSYGKNLNILKQNNMKIEIKISVYYNEANEATLDAEVKTQEADIYEVFQTLEEVKKRYYEDYKRKKEAENILELLNQFQIFSNFPYLR